MPAQMTARFERICVFCGSNPGRDPIYEQAARTMGALFAARGITLVFGGGGVGLMGAIARACLSAGGRAIGVIPAGLRRKEMAFDDLSELIITRTMHERKQRMADLADAFIALPGGFGTFEELCEMLTWAQLGVHEKPCGLLNVKSYYTKLLAMFDHAVAEGFVRPPHRAILVTEDDPERLLAAMQTHRPPAFEKWMTPETA